MTTETMLAAVAAAATTPIAALPTATATAEAAAAPELLAKTKAEGVAEGRKLERERNQKILGSDKAKGREALANHLAFATDMTPDAAISLLEVSAKAEPAPTGSRLDALVEDRRLAAGSRSEADEATATEAGLTAAVDKLIKG